jgi:hypothetical protein
VILVTTRLHCDGWGRTRGDCECFYESIAARQDAVMARREASRKGWTRVKDPTKSTLLLDLCPACTRIFTQHPPKPFVPGR